VQLRNILLGAAGLAVLGALLVLVLQVRGDRTPEISDEQLAQARDRHARMQSAQARPAPMPSAAEPPAVRRTRPAVPADQGERPPERDATLTERRRAMSSPTLPTAIQVDRVVAAAPQDVNLRMDEANGFYDRGDYQGAMEAAFEVLRTNPDNVRMLRVVVSSACIMGDEAVARQHYGRLPSRDQTQMSRRCERYGVTF
jgi:hypothetical protein